jgi:ketosteroid isomerase-like protein
MTVSLAPLSATDIAAIETTQLQFAAAFLRRDFDALAALYTDDAVVMPPNEPAVHGRTALKAWMAAFPVVTDFTLSTGRIEGRADLAYVRGTYTMTLRPEGGQTPVMVRGKYLEIRRRQSNGEWLLEADMFSSDQP